MPRRTFQDPQDTHLFPGHRHVVLFYLHAHGTPTAKLLVQNNPCRTDPRDRSRAILVFSVQGGVISKDRGFDLGVLARSLVILTSPVGIKLHFWLPSPGLPQQRPRCWALARRFMVANLTMTLYSTFHAQGDVPSPSPKPRAGE